MFIQGPCKRLYNFINNISFYGKVRKRGDFVFNLNSIAQATTELAIFGTIMLLIFGALLRYGMIFNAKQETQIYAFRKALELTKRRHEGAMTGNPQLASVNLNVNKDIYPVNIGGVIQDSTVADGSAAISAEPDAQSFGGDDGEPEDLDDIGGTYYQIGNKMILEDEYIQPAYIRVKRKIREGKIKKTAWGSFTGWISKVFYGNKTDYKTWQTLPYWKQEQYTNVTRSNQYETIELQDEATYGQVSTTHTVSETRFKPQPFDKIKEWDEDIITIYKVEGYPGGPEDMVVTTDQTFIKQRLWESQK